MTAADRLHLQLRSCALCYRGVLFTRILLAAGFIPTGVVKLLGRRFTTVPTDTPVGSFFEAMFQTGLFWHFIGLVQVVAGVLLLIPCLAHLGAAMFLPVMVSIFVLTVGLSFGATAIVTGSMLAAVTFLCAWDYHRFRPLLTRSSSASKEVPEPTEPRLDRLELIGFSVFACCLLTVFGATRSLIGGADVLRVLIPACVLLGTLGGLFTMSRFLLIWKRGAL